MDGTKSYEFSDELENLEAEERKLKKRIAFLKQIEEKKIRKDEVKVEKFGEFWVISILKKDIRKPNEKRLYPIITVGTLKESLKAIEKILIDLSEVRNEIIQIFQEYGDFLDEKENKV